MVTRLRGRLLSPLLALTAFGAAVTWAVAAPAAPAGAAAVCPAVDVPTSTKTAMAVFEGTVSAEPTTSAKTDGSRGALYDQTVTVQTVYQGRIRTSAVQVQTDRTPQQCSLGPLKVGRSYLFFVQGAGSADNPWVAVSGAGTGRATAALVASVESILGSGSPPVQPAPTQAEFTALRPAPPRSLTRTAAPGAALVLVGLLGLGLVRGRRRGVA